MILLLPDRRIWFNDEILEEDIEMLAILKVTNAAKFDSISFVSRSHETISRVN